MWRLLSLPLKMVVFMLTSAINVEAVSTNVACYRSIALTEYEVRPQSIFEVFGRHIPKDTPKTLCILTPHTCRILRIAIHAT